MSQSTELRMGERANESFYCSNENIGEEGLKPYFMRVYQTNLTDMMLVIKGNAKKEQKIQTQLPS